MKSLIPPRYLELLNQKDFFTLTLIIFLFQVANSFILLALIVLVFAQTGSNFGVSGVILSFATPGFFLMAIGGLMADLFDRRRIMIAACSLLAVVVLAILLTIEKIYASIVLSFLYFAINSFFLPSASAANVQLVSRPKLLAANSIFILTLAGGQLLGFLFASLVHFFFGNLWMLVLCEMMILAVIWLICLMPSLQPRSREAASILRALLAIWSAFIYIFKRKIIWFFFLIFGLMQGLVAFGVTLGPGFFDEVVGIAIDKSPLLALPPVIVGVGLGAIFIQGQNIRESSLVVVGLGIIGLVAFSIGLILKYGLVSQVYILIPAWVLLTAFGFGIIVATIASRTVLQRAVSYNFQGTVFGAMVVMAAFFAGVMSPLAAGIEALIGYINILIFGGLAFTLFSFSLAQVGNRWKF